MKNLRKSYEIENISIAKWANITSRHSLEGESLLWLRNIQKNCSSLISLGIEEVQTDEKTKSFKAISPTRMVKIKCLIISCVYGEFSETKTLTWPLVGFSIEDNLAAFRKMKNVCVPYDPEGVLLLGLQHRETVNNMLQKKCMWVLLPHYWKYKIRTWLYIRWYSHTTVFS